MNSYTVRVYATAQVTANNKEHAREILAALANGNGHINGYVNMPHGDGDVFIMATIEKDAPIEWVIENVR